jgi:hypothetical protein
MSRRRVRKYENTDEVCMLPHFRLRYDAVRTVMSARMFLFLRCEAFHTIFIALLLAFLAFSFRRGDNGPGRVEMRATDIHGK